MCAKSYPAFVTKPLSTPTTAAPLQASGSSDSKTVGYVIFGTHIKEYRNTVTHAWTPSLGAATVFHSVTALLDAVQHRARQLPMGDIAIHAVTEQTSTSKTQVVRPLPFTREPNETRKGYAIYREHEGYWSALQSRWVERAVDATMYPTTMSLLTAVQRRSRYAANLVDISMHAVLERTEVSTKRTATAL